MICYGIVNLSVTLTSRPVYPMLIWTDGMTYAYLAGALAFEILIFLVLFFLSKAKNSFYNKKEKPRHNSNLSHLIADDI